MARKKKRGGWPREVDMQAIDALDKAVFRLITNVLMEVLQLTKALEQIEPVRRRALAARLRRQGKVVRLPEFR